MLDKKISRRRLLQSSSIVAASTLVAPSLIGRAAAAGVQLTVADPGGPFGPAFRAAFYDPF